MNLGFTYLHFVFKKTKPKNIHFMYLQASKKKKCSYNLVLNLYILLILHNYAFNFNFCENRNEIDEYLYHLMKNLCEKNYFRILNKHFYSIYSENFLTSYSKYEKLSKHYSKNI